MGYLQQIVQPTPKIRRLYTPAEVAAIFRVDPKTVTRWAAKGTMILQDGTPVEIIRTPGGHRRFDALQVDQLRRETVGQ